MFVALKASLADLLLVVDPGWRPTEVPTSLTASSVFVGIACPVGIWLRVISNSMAHDIIARLLGHWFNSCNTNSKAWQECMKWRRIFHVELLPCGSLYWISNHLHVIPTKHISFTWNGDFKTDLLYDPPCSISNERKFSPFHIMTVCLRVQKMNLHGS